MTPSFWAELPGNLRAPGRARASIRHVLASWGMSSLTSDTELLASELVANAAEHTPGRPIGLLISQTATDSGQSGIRCEITDTSPDLPTVGPFERTSERGRGLAIVTALAADSGITTRPGGKTAWFALTSPNPTPPVARPLEMTAMKEQNGPTAAVLRARARAAQQEEKAAYERYEAFGDLGLSAEWPPGYEQACLDAQQAWVTAETAFHELDAFLHPRRYARKGYRGDPGLRHHQLPEQVGDPPSWFTFTNSDPAPAAGISEPEAEAGA